MNKFKIMKYNVYFKRLQPDDSLLLVLHILLLFFL